jgi:hypothetical protein
MSRYAMLLLAIQMKLPLYISVPKIPHTAASAASAAALAFAFAYPCFKTGESMNCLREKGVSEIMDVVLYNGNAEHQG